MTLFITGSESFIGKELISRCEVDRIDYIGVDLTNPANPNCHQIDIRSRELARLIPENDAVVIHLAALSRDGDCQDKAYECFDINVMGTLNLIDAAEKRGAKQFIFASTEWVYGNFDDAVMMDEDSPIDISTLRSEYALSKTVSEANLRQKFQRGFCPITILRFGIVYGQRKNNWSAVEALFHSVRTQDKVEVGSLSTGRCFIHVKDIVDGIVKSIGMRGFEIINLQGDRLTTLKEIIEASKQIVQRNPAVIESNSGNANIRNVPNKKAKTLLGWRPKIGLEDGLISLM